MLGSSATGIIGHFALVAALKLPPLKEPTLFPFFERVDSFKPFDTNSTQPVTVQVHFLKPMLYEDYKDMKTVEIAAAVEQQIQETINKNLTKEKVEEKC